MPKRSPILNKKGERIHPAVYSYQTRRGVRYIAIAMHDRKQRWQSGFVTIKAAEEWREAEVVAMRQGRAGKAPARMTVADYIDTRWWPHIKPGLQAPTIGTYTPQVNYIKRWLGDLRLVTLDAEACEDFKARMFDEGIGQTQRHETFIRLRQILEHAVDIGWLVANPAKRVDAPRKPQHEAPLLTLKQVERLLDLAAEMPRYSALFAVAVFTGLRWGEIARMEWADIDWTEGRLTIGKGKTRASRKPIWFGANVLERLRLHRQEQMRWARELGGSQPAWVFVDDAGAPLRRQAFRRDVWEPMRKRFGLPEMHFHDLRHTAATLRAKAKVHPSVTQRALRHANVTTTLGIYTDVDDEQQREAANAVEALVLGAKLVTIPSLYKGLSHE